MPATHTLRDRTSHFQERIAPVAATAGHSARDAADTAGQTARMAAQAARLAAQEYAVEARDWAGPRVGAAVERVRDDVIPKVAGAVTTALLASEPVREEAKARGSAAVAALKGEAVAPKPKKKHRLLMLFLLTLVGGAGVAAWRMFAQKRDDDLWTTPMPTETTSNTSWGSAATTAESSDTDASGSSVSETISNATAEAKEKAEDAATVVNKAVKEETTEGETKE